MTIAAVNRFIQLFSDAFKALGAEVLLTDIERLSMLIHRTMDQPRRSYHTSTHLFLMAQGMRPRQVLATLFHDLVYVQLDDGFPPYAESLLRRVVREDLDQMILRQVPPDDQGLNLCVDLFGFQAGQQIPLYGGLNEFLSSVVAVRWLQPYLGWADLLAIVACIEATVPFRGSNEHGQERAEVLHERVRAHAAKWGMALDDAQMALMVHEAIAMANQDVGSFAEPEPAGFLANTWLLIDESNAPLKAVGVYALSQYRGALSRMEAFLSALNPDNIFHRFDKQPDDAAFGAMCHAARGNLKFAAEYLGAKLATIGLVEALAQATGGDCPVSMFLGDIRSPFGRPDRVEDFLPAPREDRPINGQLLKVFEQGRAKEMSNDLTASPLTAYIYRCLGHDGTMAMLRDAKRFFAGELSGEDFLRAQDPEMVRPVALACAHIALSRGDGLRALAASL